MKIFGDTKSGNCYKLKLLCSLLNIPHQWQHIDVMKGETRTPEYLSINPAGKIPAVQLEDGTSLWESNAILNYLAAGTPFLPDDRFSLAKVQQWQFWEQYSHEPYIAVARFISLYLGLPAERRAEYEAKQAGGHKALKVMEQQLRSTPFLAGDLPTTADISLYGYTHVAHEGGFDLGTYPAVSAWLKRIQALPGYKGMEG